MEKYLKLLILVEQFINFRGNKLFVVIVFIQKVMHILNIILNLISMKKNHELEPNFSFDLCRLGCALFDVIVEDLDNISKIKSPILKIILEWCKDDKGRNVMYKNNGEERYPDFKLYKMIARTVHNHTPQSVMEDIYFKRYIVSRKKLNKHQKIINIDTMPCYE